MENKGKYLYNDRNFKIILLVITGFISIFLSILFWYKDFQLVSYWSARAKTITILSTFASFMARSMFNGEGFGAQDVTYVVILISLILYILSFIPKFEKRLGSTREYAGFILASSIALLAINRGMKGFFGRVRPYDAITNPSLYTPMWSWGKYSLGDAFSTGSFTSGHTTTAIIVVTLAFILIRTHKTWIISLGFVITIGWAVLMAIGRVLAGDHYPSDTLWAIIIGIIVIGWIYFKVLNIPAQEKNNFQIRHKGGEFLFAILFFLFVLFVIAALVGFKYTIISFQWYWLILIIIGSVLAIMMYKIMFIPIYRKNKKNPITAESKIVS